jgi:hypothetical protein
MTLMRCSSWLAMAGVVLVLAGCAGRRSSTPVTAQPVTPVTDVDPALAEPAYWLAQPPTAQLVGRDFTKMWDAAEQVARDYRFRIDLRDHRGGQLITEPLISKQFFEVWKKDARTLRDVAEGTLDSVRRTIYFQFEPNEDGTFTLAPRVVVEKLSRVDARYQYDLALPSSYWYAVRRDPGLEASLVRSLQQRLEGQGVLVALDR